MTLSQQHWCIEVWSNSGHPGFNEDPAAGLNIAPAEGEVLPRVTGGTLCDMLRRLPEEDVLLAFSRKLVPMVCLPGLTLYVACGAPALALAREAGLKVVAEAGVQDLLAAVRAVHGARLADEAANRLSRERPEFSARRRLVPRQMIAFGLAAASCAAAAALAPPGAFWALASAASGLCFLVVVALRMLCLLPPPAATAPPPPVPLRAEELPVYSVLVPLFRETAVLGQLLEGLRALRYPREKLDIKLILEEEDMVMQRAVAVLALEPCFEVIVVPAGRPQTKPRALNYALPFCRGDLLTIYDAEDVPDSGQLLKAARRFASLPRDVACLQARLSFYNPDDNWLARQFAAEYAALFAALLPTLAAHRLPVLLGGTSNHFRLDVLRSLGGWDAHNVTEDADLGVRLARHRYDTMMLGSVTREEANTRPRNWMRQRARWLKGFLATWLVHMRDPGLLLRELGLAGFLTVQAMTIGVFASTLLHPLCMGMTAFLIMRHGIGPQGDGLPAVALAGLNLFVLLAGYGVAIEVTRRGLRREGLVPRWSILATQPLYWMLMSLAAWLALWQFLTAPFHWNKTEHGLSRRQRLSPRALPARGIA